ncbi:MAG: alpha-glucan family phosphorylase [Gammaproteobacteria bacterium]|nr:alpha-glucan family phosphorylase [Gammaproteobacteria bacterium]
MSGTSFTLEIQPRIPTEFARLEELAADLYFSWDRHTRGLFFSLDPELWDRCGHNPKVFLRRVSQKRLEEAATDRALLEEYQRTLAYYDIYHKEGKRPQRSHGLDSELVAYFCAEFGLHESLPIYSGGLGILAGDFCKAASDIALPFVAVGIFYRTGNLLQTIDDSGHQILHNLPVEPDDLPVRLIREADGRELTVTVELAHGSVVVRVWQVKAGHTYLYLLDTDVESNAEADRAITHNLYPADKEMRLRQEIVLGIGGVRALEKLGLHPAIWHINEGHPSFLLVERWSQLVREGMEFHAALEIVASTTIFTTHTPVTAGHEVYDHHLIHAYLPSLTRGLGVSQEEFLSLGAVQDRPGFNLTTFALRCSRYYNGVSRIHRRVAAALERHMWPEIPIDENPFGYVNNGIHVPTFLARNWFGVLEGPGWHNELLNVDYWRRIDAIPDATFWSVRLSLKAALLKECRRVVELRCRRHGHSVQQTECATEQLRNEGNMLVIGFARRFATYKRATLLFENPDRLHRLVNNEQRPVLLIFAGKAHPNDEPGKELIARINDFSKRPGFQGRVVLLEGYDLSLARRLAAGVDVWINVPEYPMEASGTSGMKAAINGAINLSIMDGWWADGYNGHNGWALQPHASEPNPEVRRRLEAQELLDTLENEVIPLYFRTGAGYPDEWVKMAKESMKSIIPRFNSERMVMDYINQFYIPSLQTSRRLRADNSAAALELAQWKKRVRASWPGVQLHSIGDSKKAIRQGENLTVRVAVRLNGLQSQDLTVECLVGIATDHQDFKVTARHLLHAVGTQDHETIYECSFAPDLSGLVTYKLRAYPGHSLLSRRFEMGFMKWI